MAEKELVVHKDLNHVVELNNYSNLYLQSLGKQLSQIERVLFLPKLLRETLWEKTFLKLWLHHSSHLHSSRDSSLKLEKRVCWTISQQALKKEILIFSLNGGFGLTLEEECSSSLFVLRSSLTFIRIKMVPRSHALITSSWIRIPLRADTSFLMLMIFLVNWKVK